jgi:hypothetical protein
MTIKKERKKFLVYFRSLGATLWEFLVELLSYLRFLEELLSHLRFLGSCSHT